jgi:hypothetical protein
LAKRIYDKRHKRSYLYSYFLRLAEAGHSVLLVEAGGPSHWLMGALAFAGYFMDSEYDWK